MLKGFSWNFITQFYKVLFSSIILIILARLISVEDFGIIGMAMVIVLFFNTIHNIGFDSSIIYSKEFSKKHLLSLLMVNVFLGFLVCLIGYSLSPLISYFYDNKEIQEIFRILVLTILFSSFGIVSKGYLQKKLDFKKIAIVEIIAITISGILTVYLAFQNLGYWSLIAQQLITVSLTSLGFIIITYNDIFKEWFFSFEIIKKHLKFGYSVFIFNVLNFLAQQLDVILISKLLGEKQVGIYLLAFNLILKPISLLIQVFNKTIYPVLTKINTDNIKDSYVKLTSSFFFFLAPLIIFYVSIGQIIIPELLTDKWLQVLPLLIVFGFQSIRTIIASPSGLIFLITGNPDMQWKFTVLISFPLRLIGVSIGYWIYKSALGVALGINLLAVLEMLVGFWFTFRLINLKIISYFKIFKKFILQLLLLIIFFVCINFCVKNYLLSLLLQIVIFIKFIMFNLNSIRESIRSVKNII